MTEVKIYAGLLGVAMTLSYLSWTRDDRATGTTDAVVLLDAKPERVEGIAYYTRTSTVEVSFKKDSAGETYSWIRVHRRKDDRAFVANQEFEKKGLPRFAPFKALRSLGRELSAEALAKTQLQAPKQRLRLTAQGRQKEFDVGGRTHGARDYYVKKPDHPEIFLVASNVLSDLEHPQGRFMQRKLRETPLKDVDRLTLTANGQSLELLHRNRHSGREDFWAGTDEPEKPNETAKNYIDKLERLTAMSYLTDQERFDKATPVLAIEWFDEDKKSLGQMKLVRNGEGKSAEFYVQSTATRVPASVSRFTAEALAKDVSVVMPAR